MTDNGKHLLYDEIVLRTDGGMLTEQPLPNIYCGRAVRFLFPDGTVTGREIFTCFDGELCGPIRNGSRLDTPVLQWERLISRPHTAQAFVVDRRPVAAGELAVPAGPLPVTFDDGQAGMIRVDCRLRAMIQCQDPLHMLEAYRQGAISSPEEMGIWALRTAAQEQLPTLQTHMQHLSPMDAVGRVDGTLAVDLAWRIARRAEALVPWMGVCSPELDLTVTNADTVLHQTNRRYELSLEMRKKLIDAVLTVYTKDTFSPPLARILAGYVQANPGVSQGELVQLCGGLKALSQHNSPQQIFTTAVRLGLIPPPGP